MKFLIALLLLPSAAFSIDFQSQPMELTMVKITKNGKTLNLTISPGSGAFRPANEPDIVYLITDRGPNIPHKQSKELIGLDLKDQKGKVFPVPTFTPTIYKIKLKDSGYDILEAIEIKDDKGLKITGLPNPGSEKGFDMEGKVIADHPTGLDTEAIVKLKDGTFYVSDEYLPSLVHIGADGKIIKRLIPGKALPAILGKKNANRGIEGIALSPDEKYLYYAVQSPLLHPNEAILKTSRITRLYRLNLEKQITDQSFAYQMDEAKSFRDDKTDDQEEVKLSEMAMIDKNRILVLERIESTTKLYMIKISSSSNRLEEKWNVEETRPALEELDAAALKKQKITLLSKTLLLDSADSSPKLPVKIEGMTRLNKNEWLLINDSDFGITGESTKIIRLSLPIK